jgi:hypothetical protein
MYQFNHITVITSLKDGGTLDISKTKSEMNDAKERCALSVSDKV